MGVTMGCWRDWMDDTVVLDSVGYRDGDAEDLVLHRMMFHR